MKWSVSYFKSKKAAPPAGVPLITTTTLYVPAPESELVAIVHVLAVNNSELQVIVVWLDGNRFVDVACSYACSLADLDRGR